MSRPSSSDGVLEALGVTEHPGELFDVALTHRSYAFEQTIPLPHNERLEWLGDAVVGLVVADLIYDKHPDMPEGRMQPLRAAVVNTGALADIARKIGLGPRIRVGRGEHLAGGRDKSKILADAFVSVVGAAYLTHGYDHVKAALHGIFETEIEGALSGGGRSFDSKGALQELAVREGSARPVYKTTASGPDHAKRFTASVLIAGEVVGTGAGTSKKEAELEAASVALNSLTPADTGDAPEREADARAS